MRFINYFAGGFVVTRGVTITVQEGIAYDSSLLVAAGIILITNGVMISIREFREDTGSRR